jgi:hypothetical protein
MGSKPLLSREIKGGARQSAILLHKHVTDIVLKDIYTSQT